MSSLGGDVASPRPTPLRFLRIRNMILGFVFLISFLWSILLCIAIFAQWTNMGVVERNLICIMLVVEFITLVIVPVLLVQEFRLWFDAARSLFLFASHLGIAIWFACKKSSLKCVSDIPDQRAACGLLILIIMIFSWIVPVLVVLYSCSLAYLFYRLSRAVHSTTDVHDVEKHQKAINHDSLQSTSTTYTSYRRGA